MQDVPQRLRCFRNFAHTLQAYEVTGVPPSGPLWKAASNKAAKLSAAAMPGGKADMAQLLKPFAVFIEVNSLVTCAANLQ